jgi:hypothetical protein
MERRPDSSRPQPFMVFFLFWMPGCLVYLAFALTWALILETRR